MFDVPRKWTTALLGGVTGIVVGLVGTGALLGVLEWRLVFPFSVGVGLFYGVVGVITAAVLRRRLMSAPLDSHPVTFCACLGLIYAPLVAGALVLVGFVPLAAWFLWQGGLSDVDMGWLSIPFVVALLAVPLALGCGASLGVWMGLRTRPWNHDQGDWVPRPQN